MTTSNSPLILADLSWPEIRAIQDRVELVLIPVGSNEQHGPNMAECMDTAVATAFCHRVSAMMAPRVAVAPPVPWGISFHHLDFPGTITLSHETLIQVVVEIISSLHHHGFGRFLIVNGHLGNISALSLAAIRANEELQVPFAAACTYSNFVDQDVITRHVKSQIYGHACEFETSIAMELAPEIVKHHALAAGDMTEYGRGFDRLARRYGVATGARYPRLTNNGAFGDATAASLEAGAEFVDSALRNFVAFCDELIAANPRS